ncbi:MAG: hypothetical protein H8Z69_02675 [Nanohaloarchaea archaeon]|nr:hypothetical protein [Candidatus Nanohaloarchaea archaeon]
MIAKIYKFYHSEFYERFNHLKGAHFLNRKLSSLIDLELETVDEEPTHIREREWKNLIILDALRYDIYSEKFSESDSITSVGSHSREFIKNTFSEGDWSDTVLVTANPHHSPEWFENATDRKIEDTFHAIYRTYETDWSNEGSVGADNLVRDVKSARKLFPDKKIIVHFMQPHAPLVGSDKDTGHIRSMGEGSREEAVKAYRENLDYVLEYVNELMEFFDGRTVVTGDHGELLGECDFYFRHFYGLNAKPVKQVPWHLINE